MEGHDGKTSFDEGRMRTYAPGVAIPDAKVSDEVRRLDALLDDEDGGVDVTPGRVRLQVLLHKPANQGAPIRVRN